MEPPATFLPSLPSPHAPADLACRMGACWKCPASVWGMIETHHRQTLRTQLRRHLALPCVGCKTISAYTSPAEPWPSRLHKAEEPHAARRPRAERGHIAKGAMSLAVPERRSSQLLLMSSQISCAGLQHLLCLPSRDTSTLGISLEAGRPHQASGRIAGMPHVRATIPPPLWC